MADRRAYCVLRERLIWPQRCIQSIATRLRQGYGEAGRGHPPSLRSYGGTGREHRELATEDTELTENADSVNNELHPISSLRDFRLRKGYGGQARVLRIADTTDLATEDTALGAPYGELTENADSINNELHELAQKGERGSCFAEATQDKLRGFLLYRGRVHSELESQDTSI